MATILRSGFEPVRALIPLPTRAGHTAFAHAVLDGTLPGFAAVDRRQEPRSAVICPDSGFFVAVGEADLQVADRAVEHALESQVRRAPEARLVLATTAAWDNTLSGLLLQRSRRLEFHRAGPAPRLPALAAGYRVEPLSTATAALFGRGIDPWVVRTWGGPQGLAARSFGTVILAPDGSLAAACVACAIGGGEAEIESGTDPRHRRRGLATASALRFFDQCRERGLEPAWTCASGNDASRRTAERLGFRLAREVGVYPVLPNLVRSGVTWRPVDEL